MNAGRERVQKACLPTHSLPGGSSLGVSNNNKHNYSNELGFGQLLATDLRQLAVVDQPRAFVFVVVALFTL